MQRLSLKEHLLDLHGFPYFFIKFTTMQDFLKKYILLFALFLGFCVNSMQGQDRESFYVKQVQAQIEEFLDADDYIDSSKVIRIAFTLKIDSLGEVHSAHILKSTNFQLNRQTRLCQKIENEINMLYFYNKYKHNKYIPTSKYLRIDFPFILNPRNKNGE